MTVSVTTLYNGLCSRLARVEEHNATIFISDCQKLRIDYHTIQSQKPSLQVGIKNVTLRQQRC